MVPLRTPGGTLRNTALYGISLPKWLQRNHTRILRPPIETLRTPRGSWTPIKDPCCTPYIQCMYCTASYYLKVEPVACEDINSGKRPARILIVDPQILAKHKHFKLGRFLLYVNGGCCTSTQSLFLIFSLFFN